MMEDEGFKRKLTAIMSADVVGYSKLMADDEAATVQTLTLYKQFISSLITQHRGRVIDSPGDNILTEFASVVDAVQCAVAIQKELQSRNAELREDRKMRFRIGVNLGDVIEEKDCLYGDGVNIAARLESLADPGGICISKTAFDQIETKLPFGYECLGDQTVKNIPKPVCTYRVLMEPRVTVIEKPEEKKSIALRRVPTLIGAVAIIALVVSAGIWYFFMRPVQPAIESAPDKKTAPRLPDKPSIVVLPFDNLSGEEEQEYFSDGMTDDLITDLSKINGLLVIARNSSFAYKGKSDPINQIAKQLNVRYVLEGSVRRVGNRIRINAQLIDIDTEGHLWADRFDGTLDDIFALQDKISDKIISALKLKLNVEHRVQDFRTKNIEAYDAFLKGLKFYYRNTPADWDKAIDHFESAIDLDPNYSAAYAALAATYLKRSSSPRYYGDPGNLKHPGTGWRFQRLRTREYLNIAMKDPTPIAYRVGASLALFKRRYKEAVSLAEKAVELDPNYADGFYTLGYLMAATVQTDAAMNYIKKGMQIDPYNVAYPLYLQGVVKFSLGQMKEAIGLIERALSHNPSFSQETPILAAAYAQLGDLPNASKSLDDYKKSWTYFNFNLKHIMDFFPFKNPVVLKRLADGLIKAGLAGKSERYFKIIPSNRLLGEEIKSQLFGKKMAIKTVGGYIFWVSRELNGKMYRQIPPGQTGFNDEGISWIENDMLCEHWRIALMGVRQCMTVFYNPDYPKSMKNQYISVSDFEVRPLSLVD